MLATVGADQNRQTTTLGSVKHLTPTTQPNPQIPNTTMSRLDAHQHTPTTTYVPLEEARKLANKERRKAGRERHEQRKEQAKDLSSVHKWRHHEDTHQRQEKRRDDGARTFAGLNLDNHRETASHVHASEDTDADKWHAWHLAVLDRIGADLEQRFGEPPAVQRETSGEMLLAMARPAKPRRGARRRQPAAAMTDGEPFEVVEVDGRLVALDEDGWEILPDENAGPSSLLYSDIVRGIME